MLVLKGMLEVMLNISPNWTCEAGTSGMDAEEAQSFC
jgi:hypothetical protein